MPHFEEEREINVEYLRDLYSETGGRVALHQDAGEITLDQMLHEWARHDLDHIRQIAELVRATTYLDGAGPLGVRYRLKPSNPIGNKPERASPFYGLSASLHT